MKVNPIGVDDPRSLTKRINRNFSGLSEPTGKPREIAIAKRITTNRLEETFRRKNGQRKPPRLNNA